MWLAMAKYIHCHPSMLFLFLFLGETILQYFVEVFQGDVSNFLYLDFVEFSIFVEFCIMVTSLLEIFKIKKKLKKKNLPKKKEREHACIMRDQTRSLYILHQRIKGKDN